MDANHDSTRYLHYRSFNRDGSVNSRSGATVAYVINKDGSITWAASFCHPKDNYSKALGRLKSTCELRGKRAETLADTDDVTFRKDMDEQMRTEQGYERKYRHYKDEASRDAA